MHYNTKLRLRLSDVIAGSPAKGGTMAAELLNPSSRRWSRGWRDQGIARELLNS
jgi:hypothetical protein